MKNIFNKKVKLSVLTGYPVYQSWHLLLLLPRLAGRATCPYLRGQHSQDGAGSGNLDEIHVAFLADCSFARGVRSTSWALVVVN